MVLNYINYQSKFFTHKSIKGNIFISYWPITKIYIKYTLFKLYKTYNQTTFHYILSLFIH